MIDCCFYSILFILLVIYLNYFLLFISFIMYYALWISYFNTLFWLLLLDCLEVWVLPLPQEREDSRQTAELVPRVYLGVSNLLSGAFYVFLLENTRKDWEHRVYSTTKRFCRNVHAESLQSQHFPRQHRRAHQKVTWIF